MSTTTVSSGGTQPALRLFPRTSIGNKLVMATTGVLLTGFVLAHMLGNLQIFLGPEPLNKYAAMLQGNKELLWVARIGLLVMLVYHVVTAIKLQQINRAARPTAYVFEDTVHASLASRTMFWSGLMVFAFVLYHLAHFTLGVTQQATVTSVVDGVTKVETVRFADLHDAEGRHDVYAMVVQGFRNPFIAGFYILAQALLSLHLFHGASSMLQTLGLNNRRYNWLLTRVGLGVAALVLIGNVSIPLAVLARLVNLPAGVEAL